MALVSELIVMPLRYREKGGDIRSFKTLRLSIKFKQGRLKNEENNVFAITYSITYDGMYTLT
jgi:hypothetical protein